jgi:uncharacterized protein (TIGR03435 family)
MSTGHRTSARTARACCCAAIAAALVVVSFDARPTARQVTPPTFDAASVKRNLSTDGNSARNLGAGGRMTFENYSVRRLVAAAYELESDQVIGGPAWVRSDGFDIIATAGTSAPLPQLNLMLRSLLAERFKLVVHTEEREMQTYALVKSREDGRPGPRLKRATADCGPTGRGSGPGPVAGCSAWLGPGTLNFAGQPIAQLARALGQMLGQPVVDNTGLAGGYDLELTFTPEFLPGIPQGPPGTPGPAVDPNVPTLFVALQEQLGLELESQRAKVRFVVIDSVEPPGPD